VIRLCLLFRCNGMIKRSSQKITTELKKKKAIELLRALFGRDYFI
jgi:hypothetical protein